MAHMDTVEPGSGKVPIINGDIITSDGTTVLGGDDLAGVACILEAIHVLKEQQMPHGDIYVVFSIAEEGGLFGAIGLDISKIPAKYAFVLDEGGPIGTVAVKAPYYNKVEFKVKGKSAHAGLSPEEGVSAIKACSVAIANLPFMGRIDEDTTCNLGTIKGGRARNIVPDEVVAEGELRSISEQKLNKYTLMGSVFTESIKMEKAVLEVKVERSMTVSLSRRPCNYGSIEKATDSLGLPLLPHSTGGGSDTNILNTKGITAVNISVGMTNVHSTNEQIAISDMAKATELVLEIIKANCMDIK